MKRSPQPGEERPLSPARQAWLMLVVIAPMAACYPAIKAGLEFAPPLRFAGMRTLLGGLVLPLVLLILRKPLWPQPRLARWILPLGVLATTLTFGAMFASPAYTGAGIGSVLGNTQLLGLSAVFEPRGTIAWTGGFVGLLLFLALAGTALSTWLWFWLLQRTEAGRLSLYLFLVPVVGLLIAMGGFGERLNALQGGGAALILGAIAVSILGGWSGTVRRAIPPVTESPTKRQHQDHQRTRIGLRRPVRSGIEP